MSSVISDHDARLTVCGEDCLLIFMESYLVLASYQQHACAHIFNKMENLQKFIICEPERLILVNFIAIRQLYTSIN